MIATSLDCPAFGQIVEDSLSKQIIEEHSEDNQVAELPGSLANAVLEDILLLTGIEILKLSIIKARKQIWSNNCLELNDECVNGIVPGWLVTVAKDNRLFIYRTNESGSVVGIEQNITFTKLPTK